MKKMNLPVALALLVAFSAAPAFSQGNGRENDKGKGQDRPRQEVRGEVEGRRSAPPAQRRAVPRGWCQGRGNPHNTARNCGYRGSLEGLYRDREGRLRDRIGRVIMGDGRVYDQRTGVYLRIRG